MKLSINTQNSLLLWLRPIRQAAHTPASRPVVLSNGTIDRRVGKYEIGQLAHPKSK